MNSGKATVSVVAFFCAYLICRKVKGSGFTASFYFVLVIIGIDSFGVGHTPLVGMHAE